MKWFTLLGILFVGFVVVWAAPSDLGPTNELVSVGKTELSDEPILPRDWLSDIIKAILGIDVPVLLAQIDTCLRGLDRLVTNGVDELTEIIDAVNEEIKREINSLIETAFLQALHILEPILRQLGIVLPVISSKPPGEGAVIHDFVSDVIKALLGISLEELLTNIANALIEMEHLLAETLNRLKDIALHAPAIADRIDRITDDCVIESQQLITPMLDKLYQILPIRDAPIPFWQTSS